MRSVAVPAALAAGLALTAGCTPDAAAGPAVERRDSAGVEIVTVGPEDRPLDWSLERLLVLGGEAEGPEGFYQVERGTVAADPEGRIYVLDLEGRRIEVFDSTGAHLAGMGREGDGPGEMRYPYDLHLDTDSTLAVWDFDRRALLRFTRAGEPLEPERMPWVPTPSGRPFLRADGDVRIVATQNFGRAAEEGSVGELLRVTGGDTLRLARLPLPTMAMVYFPDCGVGLRLPPIFHASMVWDATGGRIAHAAWPEYRVVLQEGAGSPAEVHREIRREIPPVEADHATALEELGEGVPMQVGSSGSPCELDPERVVEGRGFADRVPTLSTLTIAPDGTLWIRRREVGLDRDGPIDLFAADGEYLGTLPPDFPQPLAFLPGDRILTAETDELDVDRLVLHRIDRGGEGS